MADVLVLDASALCKLIRDEPESDSVEQAVREHLTEGGAVWSDALAAVEVVTCARRAVADREGDPPAVGQAAKAVLEMVDLQGRDEEAGGDLDRLLRVAVEAGLTGPDARYVELARGQRLLTFDAKQASGARRLGVELAELGGT